MKSCLSKFATTPRLITASESDAALLEIPVGCRLVVDWSIAVHTLSCFVHKTRGVYVPKKDMWVICFNSQHRGDTIHCTHVIDGRYVELGAEPRFARPEDVCFDVKAAHILHRYGMTSSVFMSSGAEYAIVCDDEIIITSLPDAFKNSTYGTRAKPEWVTRLRTLTQKEIKFLK